MFDLKMHPASKDFDMINPESSEGNGMKCVIIILPYVPRLDNLKTILLV
jgi:hypothetical protein